MMGWSPGGMRRSDVVLIRKGERVFGPVGEICRNCERERTRRENMDNPYWTHAVYLASSSYGVYHLAYLNRYLDAERGETFCRRRFSWKGQL